MDHMQARCPVPRTEVEPRVFVRTTENWMEVSGRFLLPVRTAHGIKDKVTRRMMDAFERHEIAIASQTLGAKIKRDAEDSEDPG